MSVYGVAYRDELARCRAHAFCLKLHDAFGYRSGRSWSLVPVSFDEPHDLIRIYGSTILVFIEYSYAFMGFSYKLASVFFIRFNSVDTSY